MSHQNYEIRPKVIMTSMHDPSRGIYSDQAILTYEAVPLPKPMAISSFPQTTAEIEEKVNAHVAKLESKWNKKYAQLSIEAIKERHEKAKEAFTKSYLGMQELGLLDPEDPIHLYMASQKIMQ